MIRNKRLRMLEGLVVMLAWTGGALAFAQSSTSAVLSVQHFGAVCDGKHMTQDTAAFRKLFASIQSGSIYVPPGYCQIDNSQEPLQLNKFTGTLYGAGYSSVVAFSALGNDGLDINDSVGLTLSNLQMVFSSPTTTRSGGQLINIQGAKNLVLRHLWLHNGDRSALRIGGSDEVNLQDIHVAGFLANGIYTVNNVDLTAKNISCSGNGDGCFETSYFDSQAPHPCENINVDGLTSDNDVTGILINSCSNVSVKHFVVNDAAHQGIWIGQDASTNTTHWPDAITVSDGTITNSGFGGNALTAGTAMGILISIESPTESASNINLSRISVSNTMGYGLQLRDDDTVNLTTNNLVFDRNGTGTSMPALYLDGNTVSMFNTCVSHYEQAALYVRFARSLTANTFSGLSTVPNETSTTFAVLNDSSGSAVINGATVKQGATSVLSAPLQNAPSVDGSCILTE